MIQSKNHAEDLFLSITKNCEKPIEKIHEKPEETLDLKMFKPRATVHFNPPIHFKGDWMIGLIDLEVHNSIFRITEENNKFELYTDTFDEFSSEELKDEVEEIPNFSDITPYRLQHEIIGPRFIQAYRKLGLEKSSTDGFLYY